MRNLFLHVGQILATCCLTCFAFVGSACLAADTPNIVFVLCDDLGYGDINCMAPETCQIATPGADRLAREGMRFTDAHSGSSVCTPTRYGLLTGRYSWRSKLQRGVVTGFAHCLIDEDRPTVGSFLRSAGYETAAIGKWHLNCRYQDPDSGEDLRRGDYKLPPVGTRIPDGPIHRGFDHFHGFHHSREMEAVIDDDRVVEHDEPIHMLPRLTRKAVEYINAQAADSPPFFLYLPLSSPHTPIVPSESWQGKSGLGDYGDFVMETDHALDQVLKALDRNELVDETLVIFTSDNGCSRAAGIEELAEQGHLVSGPVRGSKADIWEGGHRVPFIARWPGRIEAGAVCDQLICLTDLFATLAEIVEQPLPEIVAEDSVSFLPALQGREIKSSRAGVVHHSISGHFAYRMGDWKLALARGSGGWTSPKENQVAEAAPPAQLYDLQDDLGESNNQFLDNQLVASELLAQLQLDVQSGRSTKGPQAENDVDEIDLWKSEPNRRPNFLFILTDDQAPETLSAYGNTICQTPHLDRLAREGMTLTDAHHMGSWSGAVCRPSRTMIMTGRSVWRIPGRGGRTPTGEQDPQTQQELTDYVAARSMPAVFNAMGYDTFRTCKRGNTFPPASQHFDMRHEQDMRAGNDQQGSAWHGDHAVDFLKQRQQSENRNPFLMFYGFSHPHDPRNGKPEYLEKYGAENRKQPPERVASDAPPLPVNYLPEHPFHHGHPGLRDETKVEGVLTDRSEATIRNELGREYACIENIDHQIGRVLDELEALGELDNTYIIFTSDHGIAVGRHGLVGKQNLYEHTWRVPFIVRGPGIEAGSRASGFIYLMDVLPTLCELAGIAVPDGVEGVSFRPVLEGKQERVRETMYGVYCGGTKPGMRSVKTADGWKLIKYDVLDGEVRETQLFNLQENPLEFLSQHHAAEVTRLTGHQPEPHQVNLAEMPEYAEKRRELEALLLSEQRRLDDPYRLWDQPQD